jgi:hypothetical protein
MYHRHVAPCTSLVLEGELHIIDQIAGVGSHLYRSAAPG